MLLTLKTVHDPSKYAYLYIYSTHIPRIGFGVQRMMQDFGLSGRFPSSGGFYNWSLNTNPSTTLIITTWTPKVSKTTAQNT